MLWVTLCHECVTSPPGSHLSSAPPFSAGARGRSSQQTEPHYWHSAAPPGPAPAPGQQLGRINAAQPPSFYARGAVHWWGRGRGLQHCQPVILTHSSWHTPVTIRAPALDNHVTKLPFWKSLKNKFYCENLRLLLLFFWSADEYKRCSWTELIRWWPNQTKTSRPSSDRQQHKPIILYLKI